MTGRDRARRTALLLTASAAAVLPGLLVPAPQPPAARLSAHRDHQRAGERGALPAGRARDAQNLAYRAALQNITGTCSTAGQDVNVQVSVELVVEPGPAFAGPEVEVPYLVSVLGPGGGVLDRRDYVAKVTVAPGTRRGGTRESFSQRFVAIGPTRGSAYEVLFGFAPPPGEGERLAPRG